MYGRVRSYLMENKMIEPGDLVLAGVSGGADSMAMLSMLHRFSGEMPFELRAVHVHHGIRGEEADRDQRLVEEYCRKCGIPFKVYAYPVPRLAKEWKMGLEEAGRLVRRQAFQEEGSHRGQTGKSGERGDADQTSGCTSREGSGTGQIRTALAHNENDLAETMLHHLARGTGLRGLASMRPVSGGIIRPVLCLSRDEILEYLDREGIPFVQDSSNFSDAYTRNRIRHHILPLLKEEVNPRAGVHMAETARVAALAEDFLTRQGQQLAGRYRQGDAYVFAPSFFEEEQVLQAYAVLEAFGQLAGRRRDFTSLHVHQVLKLTKSQTGRYLRLPYGLLAEKTYGGVLLGKSQAWGTAAGSGSGEPPVPSEGPLEWELPVPGVLECPLGCFRTKIFSYEGQKIEEKKCTKWMDYDKIGYNLCARTRRAGDFLTVNSRGDHKKLTRCMIDEKIPQKYRDQIPLVACGSEILWLAGGRMNEKYKITPETRRVLEIQYQGGKYDE